MRVCTQGCKAQGSGGLALGNIPFPSSDQQHQILCRPRVPSEVLSHPNTDPESALYS